MNVQAFTIIIAASFIILDASASPKDESLGTIPFITYKSRVIYSSTPIPTVGTLHQASTIYSSTSAQGSFKKDARSLTTISSEQEAITNNISTADLQSLIRQVKNAVCNSTGDSDIRVWVSIDASGKLLGVGASTQSGLEITFHCKNKT